jgi:hypothetical protein
MGSVLTSVNANVVVASTPLPSSGSTQAACVATHIAVEYRQKNEGYLTQAAARGGGQHDHYHVSETPFS